MPELPTSAMQEYGARHIPSELLEPVFVSLIAAWFDMFEKGDMTINQLCERTTTLSAVASEAGAVHCVLATENVLARFESLAR